MTPKEKARHLYQVFADALPDEIDHDTVKRCAKICLCEILNRDKQWFEKMSNELPEHFSMDDFGKSVKMFEEVKTEIENL